MRAAVGRRVMTEWSDGEQDVAGGSTDEDNEAPGDDVVRPADGGVAADDSDVAPGAGKGAGDGGVDEESDAADAGTETGARGKALAWSPPYLFDAGAVVDLPHGTPAEKRVRKRAVMRRFRANRGDVYESLCAALGRPLRLRTIRSYELERGTTRRSWGKFKKVFTNATSAHPQPTGPLGGDTVCVGDVSFELVARTEGFLYRDGNGVERVAPKGTGVAHVALVVG
jgi:hypothetical protein